MSQTPSRLFCFGLGYSALVLARGLIAGGWQVAGTCRTEDRRAELAAQGIEAVLFDRERPRTDIASLLTGTTHLLSSVPPDGQGDPVLDIHGPAIAEIPGLAWTGYLSTTGVYGDSGGDWVTEESSLRPSSARGRQRVAVEAGWLDLYRAHGLPVHVFRLAGIYGPGRSALDRVRSGAAQRIDKPGHLFGRIHVEDIAGVLRASMVRPNPGTAYNVCDDEPAAPGDVVAYACELLGVAPPAPVSFEEAAKSMSPMALSFWRDNRRVDNARIKRELGVALRYPDYRSGLRAVLSAEKED